MRFIVMIGCLLANSASASVSYDELKHLRLEFIRYVTPAVKEAMPDFNRDLSVIIKWSDNQATATAGIYITGGLARLPYMTVDAMALILCHEIGHSRALTEYYTGEGHRFGGEEIMADYFAAGFCLPHMLRVSPMLRSDRRMDAQVAQLPESVQQACRAQSKFPPADCMRTFLAAKTTIDFIYRENFVEDYRASRLPEPSPYRRWRNEADFVQCRQVSLVNAIFGRDPMECRDIP